MKLGFLTACLPEHEDPVWGGTGNNVHIGLRVAHRTLRPLLIT